MRYSAKKVLLTFDVEGLPHREDFVNNEVLEALHRVLKSLKKYDLKGLFFITGSAGKNVTSHREISELLRAHEIGYHSTSHSVKPRIFEYTDIESYESAIEIAHERETSQVNPFTGTVEGKGGILSLQQAFPEKKISAFRAPFFSWSPPHLEALKKLGFRFDFSSDMCKVPVFFKGVTFMPYPMVIDSILSNFHVLIKKMISEEWIVFLMHPSHMVFKAREPTYPEFGNPFRSVRIEKRPKLEIELKFHEFESFLCCLLLMQKKGLIEIQNSLEESKKILDLRKLDIKTVYERSLLATKRLFGYEPKFILSHFFRFLEA